MTDFEFRQLVERYLSDECSPEDIATLRELMSNPAFERSLDQLMSAQLEEKRVNAGDFPETVARIKEKVAERIKRDDQHGIPLWRRWVAAAAILVIVGSAGYFFLAKNTRGTKTDGPGATATNIISPGKQGAILTLDDGRKVVLDSLGNGVIANEDGTKVLLQNGSLVYVDGSPAGNKVLFNTMTTPKGRQFHLQLQDGSQVWLNAASSIRYPIVFAGADREVEITGEAYFEVAKDQAKPFRVKVSDGSIIEVIGTHFNINSYTGEGSVKTTLLEGKVRIVDGDQKEMLKPGQQAQVNGPSGTQRIRVVDDVDIEKVMAWKNGLFNFEDASLKEVMGQLERWYDIEVVYEKNVPQYEFVGKMGRDLTLNEVLRGLEVSEVRLRLEGRKLIVLP